MSRLGRYKVVVAAQREMKWFAREAHREEDKVVLTAGREDPGASGC